MRNCRLLRGCCQSHGISPKARLLNYFMMTKDVKRLFEQFNPEHYTLALSPESDSMIFSGQVVITGKKTGRPSQRIVLHQKDIKITKAELIRKDKKGSGNIVIDRINHHNSFDEVRLHASQMLYPGHYTITLWFEGVINDKMHGLYPCYFTHKDIKKKLLATQFESHHAREVFPCIDEPEAKATFDLTLTSPKNEQVLANTPVLKQQEKAGKLVTVFETTPRMSTYLLAFVIGELHCVETTTTDNIVVRTWATVAQPKSSLTYANNEAKTILEFFTDYFQTPFPLKKLDQVALPDFESGAMENWGLITYREIALLASARNRSLTGEQYVSMVVGHEVSHQWFGNLVTMKWWDDLWLNESFASIMEHIALDSVHPDWHQWEGYTASDVIACSNRDIYSDVQPVRVKVSHPDEISTLFDPAIVYAKGGRLLKMLREFIGDDAFRKGLKMYFTTHAYQNTTRDDLWEALSAASGQDVHSFMNPWLEQSGMPVISLEANENGATARQERFVLDSTDSDRTWPVATLSEGVEPRLFTTDEVTLTHIRKPLVLNEHGSGHYIVNYGQGILKDAVDAAFASRQLPSETRVNYLNDLLLLARRGDLSLAEALDVVRKSNQEPRDAVWSLMSRAVGLANAMIEDDEASQDKIKHFRCLVAAPLHKQLGWDDVPGDDPNTKLLRLTTLSWMLAGEDSTAMAQALARYEGAGSIKDINAEHRGMILSTIMKSNPKKYFEHLIETYSSSPDPDIKLAVAGGLAAIKDPAIGKQLISRALGQKVHGFVRSQDLFSWFAYLMRNRYTRTDTWEWFVTNWDRLYSEFNDGKSMDHFVVYAAGPLSTMKWQTAFNKFFEPKLSIVALTRNIKIAQAEIAVRVAWRNRDSPKLKTFLDNL